MTAAVRKKYEELTININCIISGLMTDLGLGLFLMCADGGFFQYKSAVCPYCAVRLDAVKALFHISVLIVCLLFVDEQIWQTSAVAVGCIDVSPVHRVACEYRRIYGVRLASEQRYDRNGEIAYHVAVVGNMRFHVVYDVVVEARVLFRRIDMPCKRTVYCEAAPHARAFLHHRTAHVGVYHGYADERIACAQGGVCRFLICRFQFSRSFAYYA